MRAFLILMLGLLSPAQALADAEEVVQNKGGGDRIIGAPFASRSVVLGTNGMAATSHPLASQIAIDILKSGGNAVDAAIAANAALGLMEPTGNGIGGDIFVILWDPKTQKLYGLNGSGRSPQGQTLDDLKRRLSPGAIRKPEMRKLNAPGDRNGRNGGGHDGSGRRNKGEKRLDDGGAEREAAAQERAAAEHPAGPRVTEIPNFGSLSVSVPGTVDGWFTMHGRFGSKPMADILAPAIAYAREGFPVTQVVAQYMAGYKQRYERLHIKGEIEEIENFKATYVSDGHMPVEGQIFRNPDLGNTLEKIAIGGRDVFYKGDLAVTMSEYMARIGGPLKYDDFASHTSDWVEPQSVNYRGYDVWELPPNGQGIAALQMLNILEGFDVSAMDHNGTDFLHLMTETKKIVYEDRAKFYADMDFYDVPMEWLLSKEYAAERRALIDMTRAATEIDPGDPKLEGGDTIYLTVADKDGMMVSLIQSNYRGMGSGLVPDGLGFIFQDRGALFSLDPRHANAYAPGKRPFHTIIPAFMSKDGVPIMSFGLMGGGMQPQGHAQIVINLIDFGMNLQEAGDVARWHHKGSSQPYIAGDHMTDGGILQLESGVAPDTVRELRGRGHMVEYTTGPFGGYQAIWRNPDTGVYYGASEMRKDGMAIGY